MYNSFNTWGWLDSLDNSILKNIEIHAGARVNGILLSRKEATKQKDSLTLKEKIVKKMSRPNKK